MNRTIGDIQKDIELLGIKGGYDIEQLLTPQDCRRLSYEIKRLNNIIKELREMLEHKVEFHKNLDFYEDKDIETQAYYNYVACLQDFDEIVEKYKLGK